MLENQMEFRFTTIPVIRLSIVLISLVLFWLSGTYLIAVVLKSHLYPLFFVGIPAIVALHHKFFFRTIPLTIIFSEEGFELKEKKTSVKWDELVWFYYADGSNNWLKGSLRLKRKSGEILNIQFFRHENYKQEWIRFSDLFFNYLQEKCPGIRNYYDLPIWSFYVYFLIGILVLFPVVFIILKVKMETVMGPYLVTIGTCLMLIGQIISNRRKGRLVKSGLKKRETK